MCFASSLPTLEKIVKMPVFFVRNVEVWRYTTKYKKLIMIHRRKALICFAEEIVIDVLENSNFNFTSLIQEILMQKQPSEIFQKIKKCSSLDLLSLWRESVWSDSVKTKNNTKWMKTIFDNNTYLGDYSYSY